MQIKKVALLIWLPLLLSAPAGAQQQDPFCNDDSYRVLQRVAGETIEVTCDTVYLLNKGTFNLLHTYYKEYQEQSAILTDFSDAADSMMEIYNRHAEAQKADFDSLGNYYHKLSDSSKVLVDNANTKLQSLNTNLDTMQQIISNAKTNLTEVGEMVKRSERKKWLFGAVGGAIGFGFGFMVAATIVSLATK